MGAALARAKALVSALGVEEVRIAQEIQGTTPRLAGPSPPVTYEEVLADSELMPIIDSIKPELRHGLARIA